MNFVILSFLCLLLNVVVFSKNVKIIGGQPAFIFEFPHHVSLRVYTTNQYVCSGTIISQWHILTVAHCFTQLTVGPEDLAIYAGTSSMTSVLERAYRLTRIYIHPEYTGHINHSESFIHDIAVVALQDPIPLNLNQQKVELPTENIPTGALGLVSGWGSVSYPVYLFADQLQKTIMKVLNQRYCQSCFFFGIHEGQFCAVYTRGVGLCLGDSGSALVIGGKVVGISSFVYPCATGKPDVFINIYYYLDFIKSIIDT